VLSHIVPDERSPRLADPANRTDLSPSSAGHSEPKALEPDFRDDVSIVRFDESTGRSDDSTGTRRRFHGAKRRRHPSMTMIALAAPLTCTAQPNVLDATRRRPVAPGRSIPTRATATGWSDPVVAPVEPLNRHRTARDRSRRNVHRPTRGDDPTDPRRRLPQTNR